MAESGVQMKPGSVLEPGTSHTSWYFCLRFYTLNSQALPRGSHIAVHASEPRKSRHNPAGTVLPWLDEKLGDRLPLLWVLLRLQSMGSAGVIPGSLTYGFVLKRKFAPKAPFLV